MGVVRISIVTNPKGFTATLRFKDDPSKDVIMSRIIDEKLGARKTKMKFYSAIEGYVRRGGFAG